MIAYNFLIFSYSHLWWLFYAARGQGMKLIVNGKSITRKMKSFRFWAKPMLCTSKKCLEHVNSDSSLKKYDFFEKKNNLINFFDFFSFGVAIIKILFFSIYENFNFSLKNGFNGTYRMLKGTKSWNLSSLGASTMELQGIVYMCGNKVPTLM